MKKYRFILKDLDCANCANKIQNKLAENPDYKNVIVNFNTLRLTLETDKEDFRDDLVKVISELEPEVEVLDDIQYFKQAFILKDLDCANCANKIQNKLAENSEYKNVVVNFNTLRLTFESRDEFVKDDIIKVIKELEPEVEVLDVIDKEKNKSNRNYNLIRLILGIILAVCSYFILKLYLPFIISSYLVLLYRCIKNAIKLLKGKTIDENFLITVSCIGAYLIGDVHEGLMVIILYEIGKLLEEKAINNTRKSISSLMDIKPEYANLVNGASDEKVSPDKVNIDDIILVKQGEKIPLDGNIIEGKASLNVSSLTGESKLKDVSAGDEVLSGSINENGLIKVRVTKSYENSIVSKILELVENATDKKAKTETFVNKASRIYTPIIIILAIITGILTPLLMGGTIKDGIYKTLIFLVVSCPCAIVISIPLSYFTGIGKASKEGILIKGSNYLDVLKNIKHIAFDKTGTLTEGEFSVDKIVSLDDLYSDSDILKYIAFGESNSNHPISKAILKEYKDEIKKEVIKDFKEFPGKGLEYNIDSRKVKIGTSEFIGIEKEKNQGTVIYLSIDEKYIGYVVLNDKIKKESKEVIEHLNSLKIETIMLTGDSKAVAEKVGKTLAIQKIESELLPQGKYEVVEKLIKENNNPNDKFAFVGDGINDSPVLALSDIGISMGGVGTSSAIEASDVVIMNDDLSKILKSISISKYTNKIIKQNLIFALGIKIIFLILTVLGLGKMWQAVFADVGVTLITILNTLRILKKKF